MIYKMSKEIYLHPIVKSAEIALSNSLLDASPRGGWNDDGSIDENDNNNLGEY